MKDKIKIKDGRDLNFGSPMTGWDYYCKTIIKRDPKTNKIIKRKTCERIPLREM